MGMGMGKEKVNVINGTGMKQFITLVYDSRDQDLS